MGRTVLKKDTYPTGEANKSIIYDPVVQSIESWLGLMELACCTVDPRRKIVMMLMHGNSSRERLHSAVYYQELPNGAELLRQDVLKLAQPSKVSKNGKTLSILKISQREN
jgi:hypothetical protein